MRLADWLREFLILEDVSVEQLWALFDKMRIEADAAVSQGPGRQPAVPPPGADGRIAATPGLLAPSPPVDRGRPVTVARGSAMRRTRRCA